VTYVFASEDALRKRQLSYA